MLQQTQVATVIPYFRRFLQAFPTVRDLANADEQAVLKLWQGLGYYSRARNLRRAAKTIVDQFDGNVPRSVDALRSLPGVGRYTAGAVASIAFDERAPIVDGNVVRVLCRLDCIREDPRDRAIQELLWTRAAEILPEKRTGDFNSAMMELGATVCTPRNPRCLICPVRDHCEATAAGVQDRIPPPKVAKPTPLHRRWVIGMQRSRDNRWLIEQRPPTGRWAGMWQLLTIEASEDQSTRGALTDLLGGKFDAPRRIGSIAHGLTHRRYEFELFVCQTNRSPRLPRDRVMKWATLDEIEAYPLPRPHVRIVHMLREIR